MGDRENLVRELDVKLAMLLSKSREQKGKIQTLEAENNMLKEQNALLQKSLQSLKDAKALMLGEGDIKGAHLRVSRLIREIDKCIALLSV